MRKSKKKKIDLFFPVAGLQQLIHTKIKFSMHEYFSEKHERQPKTVIIRNY